MAHTAITDPEFMEEREEGSSTLNEKLDQLADWIRESRSTVVFTGAGISTSAGIGDFRGPQGAWTRRAKGLAPLRGTPTTKAVPTLTHMGIVSLVEEGLVTRVVSQNCDGVHIRSGLSHDSISELHGNSNIEYCIECGQKYLRDFACRRVVRGRDHYTGRHCVRNECGGRLWDSTIDFGQNLPEEPLAKAYAASQDADLHIVFGSSLTVSPACDMPRITKETGGRLVIVNLQKTPLSNMADAHIFAKTDLVMAGILDRLAIQPKKWSLRRKFAITYSYQDGGDGLSLSLQGLDADNDSLPASIFRAVRVSIVPGEGDPAAQEGEGTPLVAMAKSEPFDFRFASAGSGAGSVALISILWMGHYNEPRMDFPLPLDLSTPGSSTTVQVALAFDPVCGTWEVSSRSDQEQLVAASVALSPLGTPEETTKPVRIGLVRDRSAAYLSEATKLSSLPPSVAPESWLWSSGEAIVPEGDTHPAMLILGGLPPRGSSTRAEPRVAVYTLVSSGGGTGAPPVSAWFSPQAGNLDLVARGYGSRSRDLLAGPSFLTRWLAASAPAGKSSVIVFGGCDGSSMYNDLNLVTVALSHTDPVPTLRLTATPVLLSSSGSAAASSSASASAATLAAEPSHRLGASLTRISDSTYLLFGGCACVNGPYEYYNDMYLLSLEEEDGRTTGTWTQIAPGSLSGSVPAPRAQHAARYLPECNSVLFVGGISRKEMFTDAYLYDIDAQSFVQITPPAPSDDDVLDGTPDSTLLTRDDQAPFRILPARPSLVPLTHDRVLVWGLPRQSQVVHVLSLPTSSPNGKSILVGWDTTLGSSSALADLDPSVPASAAVCATLEYESHTLSVLFGGVVGQGVGRAGSAPLLVSTGGRQ